MEEPKTTEDAVNDGMIAALRHERLGYVQRAEAAEAAGDEKAAAAMRRRVAQVDEQLRLRDATPSDGAAEASEGGVDPAADPEKVDPPKGAAAGKRGQQTRA